VTIDDVKALAGAIRREIARAVTGQEDTIDLLLVAMFARGHILLEGPPGTAKTLIARCFARALALDYSRIQFTPDLMPGDIIGANIFNFQTNTFFLTRGPLFCELLLADEINRTPPKTQAALLEAMQERSVTFDGTTHRLSPRFMVVATQNPIEQQGVYPLPEAQLDRFLFKHRLDYPSVAEEIAIVTSHGTQMGSIGIDEWGIEAQADGAAIDAAIAAVSAVRLVEEVVGYIVALIRATREHAGFEAGASPRAAAMLASAARARAALDGRDYVIPDDAKALALPVLRHRVILSPSAQIEGQRVEQLVAELVERIEVPR
jgi:MoxR-like ATPase